MSAALRFEVTLSNDRTPCFYGDRWSEDKTTARWYFYSDDVMVAFAQNPVFVKMTPVALPAQT